MSGFALRALALGLAVGIPAALSAQVHYHDDGQPWKQRAHAGPDAVVPGWFYNLGITGLRVELVANEPKALVVRYVFAGTPAMGRIEAGDVLVGVDGQAFANEHQNGYGMKVFGARGPIEEFATALEACQAAGGNGKLRVSVRRGNVTREATLAVGKQYGAFAPTFPSGCEKSAKILSDLYPYLLAQQNDEGSFGNPVSDTFAPLALLASGKPEHRKAVERCARFHARVTKVRDEASLINWRYMAAAIVLSEYYLATKQAWVKPELQKLYELLEWTQYMDPSQIHPRAKQTHPDSYPKDPRDSHGGWGHNPGFEGYGPICMLTGQGALSFALLQRCGSAVDRARHDAAYAFLQRATGPNGYVWYEDDVGDPKGWADMGRTGAAGVANWLAPQEEPAHRERALAHAKVIGEHPQSFPDTHGSPVMGMAYAALAANADPESFRKLMDANRWWFALAQCADGSFYYQPNRDNAGYGAEARTDVSSVVAFILSIPKRNLVVTGKDSK